MKKIASINPFAMQNLAAIALCVILAGAIYSCGGCWPHKCKPASCEESAEILRLDHLVGTKWRLDYIYRDYGREKNIILETHDCDTCYTLTYDMIDEAGIGQINGVSILNTVNIQLDPCSYPTLKISVTELDEPSDGNQYSSILRSVRIISTTWDGDQLVLSGGGSRPATIDEYYSTTEYSLFYKRINL